MKQRVKVIGITGGIASGKSTVAKMLRSLGASIIDADKICHQLINTEEIRNKISKKWGSHILNKDGKINRRTLGEIVFEDVRLPGDALLGKLGDGVKICFSSLNQTRLSCAAGGVGLSQACLDTAVQYCNEREQFGQQVGKFQMNQELIANMATEIEACRLLTYRAAWQKDQGQMGNVLESCYAKFLVGETVTRCAHSAMKILGAYGYSTEYPVARFYRDAVVYQIVEGTVNVQKMIIAQDQLGYRKANR